jgi:two-component system nitrate/nitrite response regulator NarL
MNDDGRASGAEPSPIRIVIIDDNAPFRRRIVGLLQRESAFAVVGEAADGIAGVKQVKLMRPDVVLLDLHMAGVSGLEAMRAILGEVAGTRVVMLTVSEDAGDLLAALKAGALGYLLKNIDSDFLVASVHRAARGESVVSAELTGKLMDELRGGADRPSLSPREREILAHLSGGASNKEIARELAVAESTVKIHVQHILRKLGLTSRVQAAVWAAENGIVPRREL